MARNVYERLYEEESMKISTIWPVRWSVCVAERLPAYPIHDGSLKLHLLRAVDMHTSHDKSLHFPGCCSRVLTWIPKNTSGSPERSPKARQLAHHCANLVSIAMPIH